ncbi:MAG: phosphate uptake regulator PhoU [Candidatus Bathyarchaeota archaeon]|nr:phosphate uptake regulator PhoU [Candidatus Bathyarchaeota archaeon]
MELRKVQRTNSGTFFVSLPKAWAVKVGLTKGTPLAIRESIHGQLCIDSQYELERKLIRVVIKPSAYLGREIVAKYLLGYDEICVESKNAISPQERILVKQTSSRLIGLEIVEEDFARLVLQCLLEPTASSPAKILRREYNIAASMYRDSVNAFLVGDVNLAKNVIARDVEVNRFYFLLVRTLRTVIQNPNLGEKLGIQAIDCLDYRLCGSLVEAIGDRAVEISHKALASKEMKVSREVKQLIGRFHSVVFDAQEQALRAFFGHDVPLAEEIRNKRKNVENAHCDIELSVKKRADEIVPLVLTAVSLMLQIFGHSVDIADLVMPKNQ